MSSYLDIIANSLVWPSDWSTVALLLLAVLPMSAFLFRGRFASLVALFAAAAAVWLLNQGLEPIVVAMLLVSTSLLLLIRELRLTRRQLASTGNSLASLETSVQALQLAEERRQVAFSRYPMAPSAPAWRHYDRADVATEVTD